MQIARIRHAALLVSPHGSPLRAIFPTTPAMMLLVSKGWRYFSDLVGCHSEDWLCGVPALWRWVRVEERSRNP